MIEIATAIVIVGGAFVVAVWDLGRRALEADVERVRLKTEGERRVELEAVATKVDDVAARFDLLEKQLAFGKGRR